MVLSLNVRRGSREENLATSRVLDSFTATGSKTTLIKYSSFLGVKNVRSVSKKTEIKVAKINITLTVFIRLNAAAFIKFLAFSMGCLFEGGVYFEITFFYNKSQQLL